MMCSTTHVAWCCKKNFAAKAAPADFSCSTAAGKQELQEQIIFILWQCPPPAMLGI